MLLDWLVGASQMQGISDANAAAFTAKNGIVRWDEIDAALDARPTCPRLRSYWDFDGCRYRKAKGNCSDPMHFPSCPLPRHPARKGDPPPWSGPSWSMAFEPKEDLDVEEEA